MKRQVATLKRGKRRSERSGFILIVALFTSLIVSATVIGLANVLAMDLKLTRNYHEALKARYMSEAGIADALNRLRTTGPMADSQWQATVPAGNLNYYRVTVSDNSSHIRSEAMAQSGKLSQVIDVNLTLIGDVSPYQVSILSWQEAIN